ncbi:cysteine hydrolase family protein [Reinekea sp. G2M2-21]|uniref:cysteine hydrolase family protein n=1 Tax=Reinekea sp. G2M2-21 TaxID=2788942 RepID=UPI0018AA0774|nr:cysteine hydrolase family protein [Reinekea sp. G2M2-21]
MNALLVIDVQRVLTHVGVDAENMIHAINQAIQKTRQAGGPVIFVRHCNDSHPELTPGAAGWQLDERLMRQADDSVIDKTAGDAFYQTTLLETLQEKGVTEVTVAGMQTEFCVCSTARSAVSLDFDLIFLSDAHTTLDTEWPAHQIIAHHNHTMANMSHPTRRIQVLSSSQYTG